MPRKQRIIFSLFSYLLIWAGCSEDQPAPVQPLPDGNLELIPNTGAWDVSVFVYKDLDYNNFFTRTEGWNGGDGVYSAALPDGRVFWSFGDSFYGTIDSGRVRDGGKNVFVRNAAMVQEGESFESFTSLNPGQLNQTETWIKYDESPENQNWYWPQDATVHDGKLQLLLSHLQSTGSGSWDFQNTASDVAIISLPDLQVEQVIKNKYVGTTTFGSALLEAEDGYTYIYGVSHDYLSTAVHVARVPGGDLTATWEFWNGSTWIDHASDFAIHQNAADMFSVFRQGGKYYLFTQEINLERHFFIYESDSPLGPWENEKVLYEVPEEHGSSSHGMFSYNAFLHPELSKNGELVVSYSINTQDFFDQFGSPGSADKYRPYFVRIKNWQ